MIGRGVLLTVAAALATTSTGCFWFTTKHEGTELRRDVNQLDDRVAKTEDTLAAKVTRLEEVLKQATQLLTRNSADLGAEVQSLREENASLTGLVMEAKRTVGEMRSELTTMREMYEQRIAELEAKVAEGGTGGGASNLGPDETFAEAKRQFDAGKYGDARNGFRRLITQHPAHASADDAQYYWGESYYREKDYEKAIAAFQQVFDRFAKSPLADDALFKAGESAEKLKWCTDARAYFGVLRQKYPKSEWGKKAADRDAQIKKNAKNKAKCQS
jgi:tol-pal system protein YbgF